MTISETFLSTITVDWTWIRALDIIALQRCRRLQSECGIIYKDYFSSTEDAGRSSQKQPLQDVELIAQLYSHRILASVPYASRAIFTRC